MRRDDCREFPSFVVLVVGILVASVVERVGTKEKGEEGEEGRGGRTLLSTFSFVSFLSQYFLLSAHRYLDLR